MASTHQMYNEDKRYRWKVIFGFLIFVNLIYLVPVWWASFLFGRDLFVLPIGGPVSLAYAIINCFAVLSYIITRQPHGIAKIIWYTALVAVGLVLFLSIFQFSSSPLI